MSINFEDLITINKNWFVNEFNHHGTENINDKLKTRVFTIKPSGTKVDSYSLANALIDIMPYYYKSKIETENRIQREIKKTRVDYPNLSDEEHREEVIKKISAINYREASRFFKQKTTDSKSGKYGELLLFGIVESLFRCKMIAHKITNLTNYHDEIKGGDGIFLGNYATSKGDNLAYMIGESKVWQSFSNAQKDALDSINRFYDSKVQATFKSLEFFIAQKDIDKQFENITDIDELYDRLNPTSTKFKEQIAVHPILIMFDMAAYKNIMIKAKDQNELVKLIDTHINSRMQNILKGIENKIELYPELKTVYLDFILIPIDKVENFNNTMDSLI